MKILLTNLTLAARTGTEIVTRDLALGLVRAGHIVCVFSPNPGTVADDITCSGVPVVSRLEDVPFRPDIIHGHHHVETTLALVHFRDVPGVFVCHDRLIWHDSPPLLDAIRRYVAVDYNCLERLVLEAGLPPERTRVILNAVDLRRFVTRKRLPGRPAQALVFSNYATAGADLDVLRLACEEAGMQLTVAGRGVGAQTSRPEQILGDYDLVFAKARCALEALAAGCAVILYDRQRLGPMVTSDAVQDLRNWNFGMRCLQGQVTPDAVRCQIARYDKGDAGRVTKFIRKNASLDAAVCEYVKVYEQALADSGRTSAAIGEAVGSLAQKVGSLESLLRLAEQPFAMPRLPRAVGADLGIHLSGKTPRMMPGVRAQIPVEIQNRSAEMLASIQPFPVHLSYRWLDASARRCIVRDGERSALTAPVRPRSRHTQNVLVEPPGQPGRYLLVLTLVQERNFWFDELRHPVKAEVFVTVGADDCGVPRSEMTLSEAASWTQARMVRDGRFANLGFLSDPKERMLTFVEARRFVTAATACPLACCMLTTPDLAGMFPEHVALAVADDPRRCFFQIHNRLATETDFYGEDFVSVIHPDARLHPRCWVDEKNVIVEAGVSIGPNAAVLGRAVVGEGSTIHAGVVIGSAGFQTSHRNGEAIELVHAGVAEIGSGSHVFANAVIARGLFRETTRIGKGCRIGNCAFVSHNCVLSDGAFVGHGAVVNGNVSVGANAWIGPGATIVHGIEVGEGANVSLGATVVRDVPPGKKVTGSIAIEHRKMLRLMAAAENGSRHE